MKYSSVGSTISMASINNELENNPTAAGGVAFDDAGLNLNSDENHVH